MAKIKRNTFNEIITVNLTTKEIEAMKSFVLTKDRKRKRKIIDEDIDMKSCFSRCEWVRVAVKRLLLKEIRNMKELKKKEKDCDYQEFNHNHDDLVKVPVKRKGLESEPIREFKTYKIIRRLEY